MKPNWTKLGDILVRESDILYLILKPIKGSNGPQELHVVLVDGTELVANFLDRKTLSDVLGSKFPDHIETYSTDTWTKRDSHKPKPSGVKI